jgi:hypothetical protein
MKKVRNQRVTGKEGSHNEDLFLIHELKQKIPSNKYQGNKNAVLLFDLLMFDPPLEDVGSVLRALIYIEEVQLAETLQTSFSNYLTLILSKLPQILGETEKANFPITFTWKLF